MRKAAARRARRGSVRRIDCGSVPVGVAAESLAVYVSREELRRYGVVPSLMRPRDAASPWPLPAMVYPLLRPLLLREGFDLERPILVTETSDRLGFVLRQPIEGSSRTETASV